MGDFMSQRQRKAFKEGYKAGQAQGSWVIDGNTSAEYCAKIVKGYDDGDPEIMDLCPSPLSGEWAGESISELSAQCDVDLSDDDNAQDFEDGFTEGFWDEVIKSAKYQVS